MKGVARRLIARGTDTAVSLVLLVTLTFALAHSVPGGPGYAILGNKATLDKVGAIDKALGVDTPIWYQYGVWWWHLLHGSLGNSYILNRPVTGLLAEYAGHSLILQVSGLGLGVLLSLAGGLAHGANFHSRTGRALSALELVLYSSPGFVIASLLVAMFTGILPPGGMADLHHAPASAMNRLLHLILPSLSIALLTYAGLARFLAESIDTELEKPYVRTAAAKGVAPASILLLHVLPNAVRPLITLLGLSLPGLFAGSVVIERVFSYPGLGWAMWRSSIQHDYPMLVGGVLLIGCATILGNLLADIAVAAIDPSVRVA
jgi:peptide/nickel transport system permease protein